MARRPGEQPENGPVAKIGHVPELTTYAEIDLGALERNLAVIRARVQRPILLPVKANAYGHGLVPIALAATADGWADWLGVATVAEGVELRQAGVRAPILKLSSVLPDEAEAAVGNDLRLTVTDAAGVEAVARAASSSGAIARVHLKIDTGMRRIGVEPEAAVELAQLVERLPDVELDGVFTHLAVADDPAQDEFTKLQLGRFREAVDAITARLGRRPGLVHAANSGGVLAHPDSWLDLVRPGIMSYGYYPDAATPKTVAVEPVLRLVTHLTFVKPVRAGETVSYGRTWAPSADTRIGTFPVGYGDGYSRRLSNRASVLVGGRRRPQVGTVCMDQAMVDLGPGSDAGPGERVTLIGADGSEQVTADELAEIVGTISYEVLCDLDHRVPRVYR